MNFLKNYHLLFFVFAAIFSGSTKLFCPDLGRVNLQYLFNKDDYSENPNYSKTTMPFLSEQYMTIVNKEFKVKGYESTGQMKDFIAGLVACHLFAKELKAYGQKYQEIFKEIDELCCMIVRRLKLKIKIEYEGDIFKKRRYATAYRNAFQLAFQSSSFDDEFKDISNGKSAYFSIPEDAVFKFVNILYNYSYQSQSQGTPEYLNSARENNFIKPAFGDPRMDTGDHDLKIRERLHDLLNLIKDAGGTFLAGDISTDYGDRFQNMYDMLIKVFPY